MIRRLLARLWMRMDYRSLNRAAKRAARARRKQVRELARKANAREAAAPHVPRHDADFPRPMSHSRRQATRLDR